MAEKTRFRNTFKKAPFNPHNINKHLKMNAKVIKTTETSNEIIIETDKELTDLEKAQLENFLQVGINSIWKFVKSEKVKKEDGKH